MSDHTEVQSAAIAEANDTDFTVLFVTGMSGAGRSTAANVLEDDGWYVDDLGSTNGTFSGNQRIGQGFKVDAGSRLRIGQTVLELRK